MKMWLIRATESQTDPTGPLCRVEPVWSGFIILTQPPRERVRDVSGFQLGRGQHSTAGGLAGEDGTHAGSSLQLGHRPERSLGQTPPATGATLSPQHPPSRAAELRRQQLTR